MDAKERIRKDMESLYLGNLNTVEFDLELPIKGKYGSKIDWASGHPRFLGADGKVTRPVYGMGDRIIPLWATFSYADEKMTKEYRVCILQEKPQIRVKSVRKIKREVLKDREIFLPEVAVICTEEEHLLSHKINWEGGSRRIYQTTGKVLEKGRLDGLENEVLAEIHVKEQCEQTKKKSADTTVRFFDHGEAVLEGESRFYTAQEEMKQFLLSTDDDQMLYNFRTACGLDTKGAHPMTGWDDPKCNLRGHTTGHYLSALALCYKANKEERIKEKACYMIQEMKKCQEAFEKIPGIHKGFLSGYTEEQFDKLEQYTPYPEIWAPYYTLHKILAGLLDCYEFVQIDDALLIAQKLGKWVYFRLSSLTEEKRRKMWAMYIAGEYGGMNEVMARLYKITGENIYLETAKYFDNEKLFLPMEWKADTLEGMHANQHIPQMIGAMEIFKATEEKKYYDIARFFWETVTEKHVYAIGGTGEGEMFKAPGCIGDALTENTAESCASYNMLKLTKELYPYEKKKEMIEYYERTMTNHILGGKEHGATGETVYFMPLAPGYAKKFEHENSCCHGTGMESHFKYADMIYTAEGETLFIHLFITSRLDWKEEQVVVRQKTKMEEPGCSTIEVETQKERKIKIRIPQWSKNEWNMYMDGMRIIKYGEEEGYAVLKIPEGTHTIRTEFRSTFYLESAPDRKELTTFHYGPYVLAALSDEKEYLKFPADEKEAEKHIKRNGLEFRYDGICLKPLFDLNCEPFQVYMKKESGNA